MEDINSKKDRTIKIPKANRTLKIKNSIVKGKQNWEAKMLQTTKTPSGVLDWRFDWTDWIPNTDQIVNFSISISQPEHPKKVVNKQLTHHKGVVIVWLGSGRKGTKYRITNKIKTRDGREEEAFFDLTII